MIGTGFILISLVFSSVADARSTSKETSDHVETIYIQQLADLPDPFDLSKLPPMVQPAVDKKEQVEFNFLGYIDKLLSRVPDDPFKLDTKFHLFRGGQRRTLEYKMFKNCVGSPYKKCENFPINLHELLDFFDMTKRTLILLSGFLADAPADWQLQIADKWMRLEDVNVIIVSWNKGNKYLYWKAVANTKVVARQTVLLLYYLAMLHDRNPLDPNFAENIMIVGHSLGAHIAGFIGQDFGGKIGRITGLDPAGPAFTTSHQSHRLDPGDALLVDVIHTNADFGFKFFLGLYMPVGHVDYYANDGKWQPNCKLHHFLECNHSAVINYYIAILDHELIIREYFDRNLRERFRIIAYRAKSYNQFRSGQNMLLHCPNMSRDGNDTIFQGGRADFKHCTMPIDFLKRPSEFRKELEKEYHVNFKQDMFEGEKFWFFTSAKHPYVVDHNLIKMRYDIPDPATGFDVGKHKCSMKIHYTMLDGDTEHNNLSEFRLKDNEMSTSVEYPQTTIPFVVHSRVGRYMLVDIDSKNFYINEKNSADLVALIEELQRKILKHVYKIFPFKIEITTYLQRGVRRRADSRKLGLPKTKREAWKTESYYASRWGIAQTGFWAASRFKKLFAKVKSCPVHFQTIRVQPLRLTNRFFMAVYTARKQDPKEDHKPNIVVLDASQPIPDLRISDDEKGISNPRVYLDTIIIGPNHFSMHEQHHMSNFKTPYEQWLENPENQPIVHLDIKAEFFSNNVRKHEDRLERLEALMEPNPPEEKMIYFDFDKSKLMTLRSDEALVETAMINVDEDNHDQDEA